MRLNADTVARLSITKKVSPRTGMPRAERRAQQRAETSHQHHVSIYTTEQHTDTGVGISSAIALAWGGKAEHPQHSHHSHPGSGS